MASSSLVLGIDLGTTSVKLTLLDPVSKKVLLSKKCDTNARIISEHNKDHVEQDVGQILSTLQRTLSDFPKPLLSRVAVVGVCGQMHGCMLWKSDCKCADCTSNNAVPSFCCNSTSKLFTWEDQRCSEDFLRSLPTPSGNCLPLCTGFGCATIFWLIQNDSKSLESYDCAGTVQDFLVYSLTGLVKPVMSKHNAASWGYYDTMRFTWEKELLKSANFPIHLLPDVQEAGVIAGVIKKDYYGIPLGAKVGVAFGDLQCSVLACIQMKTDAVLNIGTSSQLAVVVSSKQLPDINTNSTSDSPLQVWPFFEDKVVAVVASLTGGNAFAAFIETLQEWMSELGVSAIPSRPELYTKLVDCASRRVDTTLQIRPTLWGERHDPESGGTVTHLNDNNISLGDITASLCRGIIQNLHSMLPRETLCSFGVQRIIGSGSALEQNTILKQEAEKSWGLPLVIKHAGDASLGAALALTN